MRVDTGRLRVVEALESSESGVRRKRRTVGQVVPGSSKDAPAPAEEPEQRTPGAYIKHQRKRRGMSLDQLAAVTKIPRAQLELLEADRHDELPGMVFVKGFLRCCARALDLDADTVLGLLYEGERERLRTRRREASVTSAKPSPRKHSRGGTVQAWIAEALGQLPSARILMWLVVALLVGLIVLIAFTLASGHTGAGLIRS